MRRNLHRYRTSKGFRVEEIAKIVNVSPSTYYKWEDGSRNPTIEKAVVIAKALGGTVEELFFDNELDESSKKPA